MSFRHFALRIAFAALPALVAGVGSAQPVAYSSLAGSWTGAGRMYEVKVHKAVGTLPITLNFAENSTLTGTVGPVNILPAKPRRAKDRVDYHARLSGAVSLGPTGTKDHLVVLITKVTTDHLTADIHLKSRFGFDPSMHPGSLEAVRSR